MNLSKDQLNQILDSLKQHGTYTMAAKNAKISIDSLRAYRKHNKTFAAKCEDAVEQGRDTVGDIAFLNIQDMAFNKSFTEKTRLTANLSLANAYQRGFRGTQRIEGKVDHTVRVVTAIPRPAYVTPVIEGQVREIKQLAPVDEKRKAALYMRDYRRRKKEAAIRLTSTEAVFKEVIIPS